MSVSFSKYSGLGNDFIFVDNRDEAFPVDSKVIQNLCHRNLGVGADGLVLVQESVQADCKMRIFNADGQEAEMCGNALRCLYFFLKELGFLKDQFHIETFDRLLKIWKEDSRIACEMGEVSPVIWDLPLSFNGMNLIGHQINTGVPHVVIPTHNLHRLPILPLGAFVCTHPLFHPKGTNVNFISLNKEKEIEIRTYERGVNGETQACGTGAAAAALIGQVLFNLSCPVKVKTVQGKILEFSFKKEENQISNLVMIGSANFVFKGEISLPTSIELLSER